MTPLETPHLPGPLSTLTPDRVAAALLDIGVAEASAQALGVLVTIAALYAAVMLPFACLAAGFAWVRGAGLVRGFGSGLVWGLTGVAFVRGMMPGGFELAPCTAVRRVRRGTARATQRMRRGGSAGSPGSGLPQGSVRGITTLARVSCVSPLTQG
jgi:hypothetical protein